MVKAARSQPFASEFARSVIIENSGEKNRPKLNTRAMAYRREFRLLFAG
jgi:hypothetical protein